MTVSFDVALAGKSFAHEDALVPGLGAAPGLLVPDGGIEALILGHRLMCVKADLAIAAPHGLCLRKGEQLPAQSCALLRRGDTVDVVAPGFRCSDEALQSGVDYLRRLFESIPGSIG